MVHTGEQAIAYARTDEGAPFSVGTCLKQVRTAFGVAAKYASAAAAWSHAAKRHPGDVKPPRGVPIFWTGGSKGYGHIAISTGDGSCWSTDIRRRGHWNKVPIAEIHEKWGLDYAGWTEDVNGVTVYTPPKPPAVVSALKVLAVKAPRNPGKNATAVARANYYFAMGDRELATAVLNGRRGWVATTRRLLPAALKHLPKK